MRSRTTKAARIKNAVLDSSFTIEMALICVGFEDHEVNSDVINQVTNELINLELSQKIASLNDSWKCTRTLSDGQI